LAHESRAKELSQQLSELTQQHDSATQQIGELGVQTKIVEESRDAVRRDLAEANDNIRQSTVVS